MKFEPIAIVGSACLLPGAKDPASLWEAVRGRRDLLSQTPPDRWRVPRADVLGKPGDHTSGDQTWSDRGGYVRDFKFDPSGLAVSADKLSGLDPLFLWLLQTGRDALNDSGVSNTKTMGAVVGNLSFPSAAMAQFAERVWLGDELADAADVPKSDARNRFMSGLPAHLLAEALGLGAGAYCMDAACASSLVAIKLACDRLQQRQADTMLAGAVCCADDLFIHVGFCALKALSRSGTSRPFHADADGLVPAEGAGIVVLERLADAERNGRNILGVIRGIGLSNDGRGKGFLAPAVDGQVRAMKAAYAAADLEPSDIDYVECHATGTSVGDATELRSMAQVFKSPTPIGSLKSNLGHLITAAGVAGLLKVIWALKNDTLPPTIHVDPEHSNPVVSETPFRVVTEPQAWPRRDTPRRAAVSAFGFGGNNAHLILEEYIADRSAEHSAQLAALATLSESTEREPIAVVACAVSRPQAAMIELSGKLRFPPNDLAQTLPQQLLMLDAAGKALGQVSDLPAEATGVMIGMGCDPGVARYGARWRMVGWGRKWGVAPGNWTNSARDAVIEELESAGVLGTMPNIVANRLNSAFDLGGPSMTVSAEELSGIRALHAACASLWAGDMSAALVGAVDLSAEPVHRSACASLGLDGEGADAAVAMVLERLTDAERLGHTVLAVVAPAGPGGEMAALEGAHAASGLLAVADAISAGEPVEITVSALGGQQASTAIWPKDAPNPSEVEAAAPGPAATGRTLRFAAHRDALSLPKFPSVKHRNVEPWRVEGSQVMSKPPKLQPVTDPSFREPQHFTEPSTEPQMEPFFVQTPVPPTPPVTPASPATSSLGTSAQVAAPVSGAPTVFTQQHQAVSAQHHRFVAQQMAVHQQFLEMRARTQQQLLDLAMRAPQTMVVNPAPVTLPLAPIGNPEPEPAGAPTTAPSPKVQLPGFQLSRQQLEVHSGGKISSIFGPELGAQDGYARQVRMPEPPLLLADRMTGIDAEIGSMGLGTIWTETDVRPDSWYLHAGRMPAGIMIESGQADLMLISYLGVDLLNQGDRVYRLLGCELTYHDSLPKPGDTLCYDIHVDGHASQGDVRLFFFHYDCQVNGARRLSVRGGQAGFFTDEELANSAGVLWDPTTTAPCDDPRMEAPPVVSERRAFSGDQLRAFAAGRTGECFGPGFELASTHTRTPSIAGGRMLFLDEVTEFDPAGGPWGRGYLRAIDTIERDDWFFDGHFKNDPCMPGTLMFDGCLQAMAVYMSALGFTLRCDGWRFEPVPEETFSLRCRGQVLPSSKNLVYEVFVQEVIAGPMPMLYADILCTIDGRKAFHCERMALRLVPDWPLEQMLREDPTLATPTFPELADEPVATIDGFDFDYMSLLACAWGKPSEAFGPMYGIFDSTRKVARLPGPPYHFMSRVSEVDGNIGVMEPNQFVEIAYDVPPDAWYFDDNGARTMPYCVLLEAALQPCGWLASFVGSATTTDINLCFRNLDGTGTLKAELLPTCGTLRTRVKLLTVSATAGMIIEGFEVECLIGDTVVYEMKTVFGFFPEEAFDNQAGLSIPKHEEGALEQPSDVFVDLTKRPAKYFAGTAKLPTPFLTTIDRVNGIFPTGGVAGLGRYRAEKDVDPDEWFFKAHFFQDPVQPGSLGIEAMIQLLQFAMLERGMADGIEDARFEPVALDKPMTWKYRGQVTPANSVISTVVDLTETGVDDRGPYAVASASLWVDGKRIYEASNVGMRIVSGGLPKGPTRDHQAPIEVLDPKTDQWLADHCPTFTVPALPMMSMVDRLAGAALALQPGKVVSQLDEVAVKRWLPITEPTKLTTTVEAEGGAHRVTLSAWREASRPELSRFEPVASALVTLADSYTAAHGQAPVPMQVLRDAVEVASPYETGHLFHGPSFHKLTWLSIGKTGASALLDASPGNVPVGTLNQVLLDAATHAIPHDRLSQWSDEIGDDVVAYPYRLRELRLHTEPPTTGEVRCEVRFVGFDGDFRFPTFELQLIAGGHVWLTARLTEILMPKGRIGMASPADRRAFLRDRAAGEVALSDVTAGATTLTDAEVSQSNWLPGTLQAVYRTGDATADQLTETIAIKDHVAAQLGVHAGTVEVDDEHGARSRSLPLSYVKVEAKRTGDQVRVESTAPRFDLSEIRGYWGKRFAVGRWPVEDLYYGLIERFVGQVHVADAGALEAVRGKSLLFLGNHQVAIESLLFSIVASALTEVPTVTLAKIEHKTTWLGLLIQHCFAYPGVVDPEVITYFDRNDPTSLAQIIGELAAEMMTSNKSVMVHIEGTRSLSCRTPVQKMTSAFIDMALATRAPIVPIRFASALPVEPLESRIEFPHRMGKQDIYIGKPIHPETFEALPYKERKPIVIDAINALGPSNADEQPSAPDEAFSAVVDARVVATGASHEHATLFETLRRVENPSDEVKRLLAGSADGRLKLDDTPKDRWLGELARRLYGRLYGS